MRPVLDRSKTFTYTAGPDAATLPILQDGLYFDHGGELVDHPYNRGVFKRRGLEWDAPAEAAPEAPAPGPTTTFNPDVATQLAQKKATEIYAMATRLRARLDDEAGDKPSVDPYQPAPEAKDANIQFIARNTEG